MKLRTILLVLGLLAFFSVTASGFLYYSSLRTSVLHSAETLAAYHTEKIESLISSYLTDNQKAVRALAGLKELQQALLNPNEINLTEANLILDHFHDSLKVTVSYLMDPNGKTIASSNRNDPDSFVGKNYSFRPYFKEAIHGNPAVYMALGVTSKKRGVYYSHPVYDSSQDSPIGVVVLKAGVDKIEAEFISLQDYSPEMITFITGSHSIIFMSNHKELLYRLLWQISDEKLIEVLNSKQFGKGPWEWAGFKRKNENQVVDKVGSEYLMFQKPIEFLPGWNVVHLHNIRMLSKTIAAPFIGTIGYIILALCVFIGLSVFILYNIGKSDIIKRLKAEKELQESEEKYRSISSTVNDALITMDSTGKVTYWNKAAEKTFGYIGKEIIGKDLHQVLVPEKYKDAIKKGFNKFKETGTGPAIGSALELSALRKDGTEFPVELSMSVHRFKGQWHAVGIVRDITEQKRMEEELKRLSYLDGLTGVANRRRFDEALDLEWRLMTRDVKPLSLIMCDIDFFKAYNDTYGHQGGDECLRLVANTLKSILGRPGDLVARYGGEEYAVILPGTDSQDAKFLAEKMRSRVESLKIIHVSSQVCEVLTISLGVATTIPTRGSLPDELISAADQALYEAKKEGRNRVR